MISPSEIGQGQVTPDKRRIDGLPRPGRVPLLLGYTLILLLVGGLIVYNLNFGIIWTVMMLPIYFAAAIYPRSIYVAMVALYAIVGVLVIAFGSPRDPADSARTLFVFLIAVGISAETLHRVIGWLEQARAALRASEERFRSLSAMAPLGIFETDSDGRYTYTNPRWQAITGLGAEVGLGDGWADTIFQDDREAVLEEWHQSNLKGREFSRVFRVSPPGDGIRWVRLRSTIKYLPDDRIAGRVGTLEDITEERAAAEALRLANEALEKRVAERTARLTQAVEQLETEIAEHQLAAQALSQSEEKYTKAFRELLQQRVAAQEAERRRLSMDVHDGPLQSLGVSLIALDRAIRRLERGERELAFSELRFLRSSLAGTVAEVRSVLADLSLDSLTQNGLVAALRGNVDRFSEITGIAVDLDDQLEARLPADLELLIYRLAQEALTNVRKHAEATKVLVRIEVEGNELVMTIRDDGRGFDLKDLPTSRRAGEQLGLASMRERVQAMHGDLQITSSPGAGTTLVFRCAVGNVGNAEFGIRNAK